MRRRSYDSLPRLIYCNLPAEVRDHFSQEASRDFYFVFIIYFIPHLTMERRINRRGHREYFVKNQHLKLMDLKEKARQTPGLEKRYLFKENIPPYPQPEFHVSHLKHDTDQDGLRGIKRDGGFKNPNRGWPSNQGRHEKLHLLWWSLSVGPDEVKSAERRLLEQKYPDQTEEQAQAAQSFLWRFATSPAFEKTSMLGSYRFTFSLEEVLNAYSEQFCSGAPPIMRVFETIFYKQEVVYSVLVHSPANQEQFSEYPLLTDDPNAICTYRDGRFIWRSEAMCETHSYELVHDDDKQMEARGVWGRHEFYVWDNVIIALHVDKQVLTFDPERLRENLKFCQEGRATIVKSSDFDSFKDAEDVVRGLWPDDLSPLERAEPPQQE